MDDSVIKRFIIRRYTHGFSVQVIHYQDRLIVSDYSRSLAVFENRYDYRSKRNIRQYKFTYATYHATTITYGLHIGLFDEFIEHLNLRRVQPNEIELHFIDAPAGRKGYLMLSKDVKLREEQIPVAEFVMQPGHTKVLPLPTGFGKDHPLTTLIKIPGGWKAMRNMRVGDTVIAKDGTPTNVNGVYPQGLKDVYRITFEDGRASDCGVEHLWRVFSIQEGTPATWDVITTSEIIRQLSIRNSSLYIDLPDSEIGDEIDLPIDPYIVGVFLGLERKNQFEQFIPESYWYASTTQRLAVLQGLLDTKGTINTDGTVSYCTTSLELTKGIEYIVRSLGGIAKTCTAWHHEYDGIEYTILIQYNNPSELFRLPEKKIQVADNNQYMDVLKLRIVNVELIGKQETQCISIDHLDRLYVIEDFVVTHNTIVSLYCIAKLRIRTALIMAPMHIETWMKYSKWMFVNGDDEIIVIRGKAQLVKLIAAAKKPKFNKSLIIISLHTLRDFLTEFETDGKSTYGCEPLELYKVLHVGLKISDESHESLHFGFRQAIETHVGKVIYLSASIESHDSFTNKMYNIMLPPKYRYTNVKWEKYIAIKAVGYVVQDDRHIKCSGAMGYSHTEYEKWIMKSPARQHNYLAMVADVLGFSFIKTYQPGQKALIFMSTIELCSRMAEYLKKTLGDKFTCSDFTTEHEDQVLHTHDIVVSTPGKAGTGKDIHGLVTVISTIAINSKEKNKQMPGRLRPIDKLFPGVEPTYVTLVCLSIPKHMEYHQTRMQDYASLMKSITTYRSRFVI